MPLVWRTVPRRQAGPRSLLQDGMSRIGLPKAQTGRHGPRKRKRGHSGWPSSARRDDSAGRQSGMTACTSMLMRTGVQARTGPGRGRDTLSLGRFRSACSPHPRGAFAFPGAAASLYEQRAASRRGPAQRPNARCLLGPGRSRGPRQCVLIIRSHPGPAERGEGHDQALRPSSHPLSRITSSRYARHGGRRGTECPDRTAPITS